jgi:hypothetical protein
MNQPNAARKAPNSFIVAEGAPSAGFPSRGFNFKKPIKLIAKITTPTASRSLPSPVERYAKPTHATVKPTTNAVKLRPCPVFAAMNAPFPLPWELILF